MSADFCWHDCVLAVKKERKILMNKKQVSALTAFGWVMISIIFTFSMTLFGVSAYYKSRLGDILQIAEIDRCIDKYFYKEVDNKDDMVDMALEGYVAGLNDRYSRYQSLKETESSEQSHSGVQTGIGVTVDLISETGYLRIASVKEDSPASEAGLKENDIVKSIDGNDVCETGYDESLNIIKAAAPGSVIKMIIEREGADREISIKLGEIDIVSVTGEMLDNKIGRIRIKMFNDKTPDQLKEQWDKLVFEGARGIVFDIRNNGGGLVTSVEKCLDPLLPEGEIACAVYKNGATENIVKSDAEETTMPMVVLMNEYSASGAELFAAALRDYKNVSLVGVNSYGKGVMQDTFMLSKNNSVVLTVAQYKTMKSDCYDGTGLKPDVEVDLDVESETDNQLSKACEVLEKKIKETKD